MRLVTLKATDSVNEFVGLWDQFYDYGNEAVYEGIIAKQEFTPLDIRKIYEWKNNMGKNRDAMSKKKLAYVDRVNAKIDIINQLKIDFSEAKFQSEFKSFTAIWGIMLLHIMRPQLYPIYDQHVHRAYSFITERQSWKIPTSDASKYKLYFEEYVPFFNYFFDKTSSKTHKQVDNALWAFGKFLAGSKQAKVLFE